MSTFMGLEIGRRSIMTNQTALNITGHNISNANTPGYTRQIANLTTSPPWHTPTIVSAGGAGQLGTGVNLQSIDRIRDSFLDGQIRQENRTTGYWDSMQQSLARLEAVLNEPSDNGLRSVMDQFWKSWQDLAANPESEAVRSVVAQRGMAVADVFNHTYTQLTELREDVNANIKIKVDEVNSIASQLADLNQQILAISIAGKQPNDLSDRRDLLLDQLSKIADIKIYTDNNNMMAVQLGGRTLVQGINTTKLTTKPDEKSMHMIVWQDNGIKAQIDGGEIRGLLDARGQTLLGQESDPSEYKEVIPNLIDKLNAMAKTMAITTNQIHQQGFSLNNQGTDPDGTGFFQVPSDSADSLENWAEYLKVNSLITNDTKNIAAAATATWDSTDPANPKKINFGDGSNALAIAQLKHHLNSGNSSIQTRAQDLPGSNFSMSVRYGGDPISIDITAQADWTALINEIQTKLDADPTLNGKLQVSFTPPTAGAGDQASLVFTSGDRNFQGLSNFMNEEYKVLQIKDVSTDDFWRSLTADVGVQSQEATRMVKNQDTLINQLENKRQSISGVSLDEEMTNMIKFQHAYNAASRFITTIDEELDRVINSMGLVGR